MLRGAVVVVAVVVACCAITGVAAGNDPPQAEAGLSQTVTEGSAVYLDAGGSVDRDGDIQTYEWTITAPNGTTVEPACPTCAQTRFLASQPGEYNVTVTVTDDAGVSHSDSTSITVQPVAAPTVDLTGPQTASTGDRQTYRASVAAGDNPLSSVRWMRNGSTVETVQIDGNGTQTRAMTFDSPGTESVSVRVTDSVGNTGTDSLTTTVSSPSSGTGSASSGNTDAQGFYEEITRNSVSGGGYTYTFRFLSGDDVASNTVGPGHGGDQGGMGVQRSTMENLANQNPNVYENDEVWDGPTAYTVSGEVAENFANHGETYYSGNRVGTNDIITEDEFVSSTSESSSDGSSGSSGSYGDTSSGGSKDTSASQSGSSSDSSSGTSDSAHSPTTSYGKDKYSYDGTVGGGSSSTDLGGSPGGSSHSDTSSGDSSGGTSDSGSSSSDLSKGDSCGNGGNWWPSLGGCYYG